MFTNLYDQFEEKCDKLLSVKSMNELLTLTPEEKNKWEKLLSNLRNFSEICLSTQLTKRK